MSVPQLCKWRMHGSLNAEPFPFRVYYPPTMLRQSPRYDRNELVDYAARRVKEPEKRPAA